MIQVKQSKDKQVFNPFDIIIESELAVSMRQLLQNFTNGPGAVTELQSLSRIAINEQRLSPQPVDTAEYDEKARTRRYRGRQIHNLL